MMKVLDVYFVWLGEMIAPDDWCGQDERLHFGPLLGDDVSGSNA